MRDIALRFTAADQTLAGTLTLPPGTGPFPAVVLISGSGPLNRDSDHRKGAFGVSRELAVALAGAGVASLRYDKRGVGESTGSFLTAGLTDNIGDARSALGALAARPEVDAARLFLVGHSEGALIATALAGERAPVAGVVLLAGAAKPGAAILRWQAEMLLPSLPAPVRFLLRLTRTDLVAKVLKNHDRLRATTTDVARLGGVRVNARWFREFLDHDPSADLAAIRVPVLAITGGKDLQVDPDDLDAIAGLVPAPVETWRPDDVTHTLRRQPGEASLRKYRAELRGPVDAELMGRVTGWLTTHAEARRSAV
ncbi:alpha/beta fold hydrolase [Micromonospora sp. NPDC049679]|uniref:alpha/beta hydrolase family protein n=1 Tax=Micromonospora sp. NPDC049679 TaxID=3155920 RepID=UPI00340A166F